jgi:uncharacterized protein YjbI with pentapeptide repeats
MTNCVCSKAKFDNCSMKPTKFTCATGTVGLVLTACVFEEGNLGLSGASFKISGCTFPNQISFNLNTASEISVENHALPLKGPIALTQDCKAIFKNCTLALDAGSGLLGAKIEKCTFTSASSGKFNACSISQSIFKKIDLGNSNFESATIDACVFDESDLKNANFDKAVFNNTSTFTAAKSATTIKWGTCALPADKRPK